MSVNNSFIYPAIDTANTTRVLGYNAIEFNTYVTKIIYPSPEVEWRPNAVILVPLTTYHFGLLASPIIHFPINAPLIFTNPNYLLPETFSEIIRLSPTGKNVPAKVIIVGPISSTVEMELRNIGLSTIRVGGYDPIFTAGEALEFRYWIPSESKEGMENIMVVPVESPTECIHAAYFSAHMGVPILFSYRDKLPEITRQKLNKYKDRNVFIISSTHGISDQVLNEIKNIMKGKVDRIDGNTPFECTVNFARYYSPEGNFGWNINTRDGWSFSFGTPKDWSYCLSACIFAHLAKHTPLLFVKPDRVPEIIKSYVLSLNPMEKHPPKPPFMHGYILGGYDRISHKAQVELEKVLILRAEH
ncbi:hypothetical protein AB8U03_16565 [Clostridium sp. Mt-5]|uniref:Uncharacterized protein n=1 Tax=Clostridium moutaii TaxID=3240932 RepID=A0ABV4BU84_9CLOT